MPKNLPFSVRVQSFPGIIFLNIIIALLVYYNAELGRLLGIAEEPLAISVVWPSTGFSLASLLLFGTNVWPGIFLGNFVYDFIHLYLYQQQQAIFTPAIVGAIIAFGSLLQALMGNAIMRKYCSKGYFNTIRDVFIFLIPAGLLTCLIACTIGTTALYFYSPMSWKPLSYIWLIFWVGDTMGVYIFTPLIIVWTILTPLIRFQPYKWEALFMLIILGLISLATFKVDYPLVHLYLPFSLWVTYRFRMHGATLAIFIITIIVIVATSAGYGPFEHVGITNPLLLLITFIETVIATCLILAAVLNERETAWIQIQNHNIDLQQAIEMRREEMKEMTSEIAVKENLASLGLLTSGMVRQFQILLKKMNNYTKSILETSNIIKDKFSPIKDKIDPESAVDFQNRLENINHSLNDVTTIEMQLNKIAKVIEEQAILTSYGHVKIKSINVNMLLNKCLMEVNKETERRYPDFVFTVNEVYDNTIEIILIVPMDLAHAFFHLMNKSIRSMKEKRDRDGEAYIPILKIQTKNFKDQIKIIIKDNGLGLNPEQIKNSFFSFVETTPSKKDVSLKEVRLPDEGPDLNFTLAYDIVTHVYQGEIEVDSQEGEYLQFTVTLPKDASQIEKNNLSF